MVNPIKVKELALSPKGKEMSSELENLNWKIQELTFELDKVKAEYCVKSSKYKEFIGYSLSKEDKESVKKSEEFLNECN